MQDSLFSPLSLEQWQSLPQEERCRRLTLAGPRDPAWIVPPAQTGAPPLNEGEGPLAGVPFAVKDNIDVVGFQTTAACPEFAYTPTQDAAVVRNLKVAGAWVTGKTNLDQFATGLVGTRSPYGAVPNVHNSRYISGGSSSGSASVVARGIVPFALGTDTAGSGRVPAALNGIVGFKPTRGWASTLGVVPACRSLDCVSVFASNVDDAALVLSLMAGPEPLDPLSRTPVPPVFRFQTGRRLAVPASLPWFGDELASQAWEASLARWRVLGYTLQPIDPTPLFEMAALLYEGPWVAERVAGLGPFYTSRREVIHPVVSQVLRGASRFDAVAAFQAEDRRRQLQRAIAGLWEGCVALVVPSVPRFYTTEEVLADPLETNSRLGTWTNFVNLADLCALSVPAGYRNDGLPAGITLIGRTWEDGALADLGRVWEYSGPSVEVAVVGAHLSGLPLNPLLRKRGARLVEPAKTAAAYRLYALEDQKVPKPGLVRVSQGGAEIAVEVWSLPVSEYGAFVAEIQPPLGIGTVELSDGRRVQGFLCESWTIEGRRDITEWGGWKSWLSSAAR